MSAGLGPARFRGRVRNLSTEGYGIVNSPEGMVFFVPLTWPGDEGSFEIESRGPRYGYARLVELETPSPDRREPPCGLQGRGPGRCGGCPWMIAAYPAQLREKEHRVRHAIERAGLARGDLVVSPIWGAPEELGYRNRAQLKSDGRVLGFVEEQSRSIVDTPDCLVLEPALRDRLSQLRARLPNPDWRPSPGSPRPWTFMEIDTRQGADEEPELNRRRPFRQGNTAQNERMRSWVRARLESAATRRDHVLELFCGAGNFTELFVENGAREIVAVEVAAAALRELESREWPGVRAVARDLSEAHHFERVARLAPRAELLFLDPPRAGAKGVERLARGLPRLEEILYVSCDVATWVRDAGALARGGWKLTEVQPLDLFPQTAHVEVLSRFGR